MKTLTLAELVAQVENADPVREVSVDGLDFAASNISGAVYEKVSFRDAGLTRVAMKDCTVVNCDFSGSDLSEVDFSDSVFMDCVFDGANFAGCNLNSVPIRGGSARRCDFSRRRSA